VRGNIDRLSPNVNINPFAPELSIGGANNIEAVANASKYPNTLPMRPEYAGESTVPNPARGGQTVQYLNDTERAQYEVHVNNGLLHDASGRLLQSPDYPGIFAMSPEGRIFFADADTAIPGQFHHSSFLAGQPVAAAGELAIENGTIQSMTTASGHYRTGMSNLDQFIQELTHRGVPNANKIPLAPTYD
jgi:hypothetical protein